MEIIPAVNCADEVCARKKLEVIRTLGAAWAHVDVTDGVFSATQTWRDAATYKNAGFAIEAHLMVIHPEQVIDAWLAAGVRRVVVHVESLMGRDPALLHDLVVRCRSHGADLVLSQNPNTRIEEFFPYASEVRAFQLLAVEPGPSGQKFDERVFQKIKALRAEVPDAVIEIDGGVNPEVVHRAQEAGIARAVAASYIFANADPRAAYTELMNA